MACGVNIDRIERVSEVKMEEAHLAFLQPILSKINPLVDNYRSGHVTDRPVIGIAGYIGVGKTFFSQELHDRLQAEGISSKILYADDFMVQGEYVEGSLELCPRFDFKSLHAFFERVRNGEELIEKEAWDLSGIEPEKKSEVFDLRGVELLIFEGIFSLCDASTLDLSRYSSLKILLDADDSNTILWDWERGRGIKDVSFSEFNRERLEEQNKWRGLLEPLKPSADFLIWKESKNNYKVSDMK